MQGAWITSSKIRWRREAGSGSRFPRGREVDQQLVVRLAGVGLVDPVLEARPIRRPAEHVAVQFRDEGRVGRVDAVFQREFRSGQERIRQSQRACVLAVADFRPV